ncbi:S49 family peptidase [Stieleria sp. TO1_6]|uniref:S49 family peptidase n=1 Tax=Stieleria tagensis TaxID=2956795 RepID=UPI00209B5395|nr:S49 family peptidase [Stieleria tagensis]MCO8121463.1 S49 family peptidase [Stieleria tagensis]
MKSEPYFLAPFAVGEVQSLLDAASQFKLPNIKQRETRSQQSGVAVVDIAGPLSRRATWMTELLGLATYEDLTRQVEYATSDASVSVIVLAIDSPGGLASGCLQCAQSIANAAKQKPVVAVIDGIGASAAYFLASGATTIIAAPDSWTGSIGSVFELKSFAELERRVGIQTEVIVTGSMKAAGHPSQPITESVKQYFGDLVGKLGQHFVDHVAKYRRLKPEQMREIEAAKIYSADDAESVGLIDGVGFLSDVLKAIDNKPTSGSDINAVLYSTLMRIDDHRQQLNARQHATSDASEAFWEEVDEAQRQSDCTRAQAIAIVQQRQQVIAVN